MTLIKFKSHLSKNACKVQIAALVPFLLFGCSGGKTEKSDAGEKSKDVQVQTTGSDEQHKLALGATAVRGVSVSAVFGTDADKLVAFGLKELGRSGESLTLAGPVYKLSATAGLTPGPDGCFAILPVTSGSICFDEMISASRFLVPSMVPGTSAVPGLGLAEVQQKSSDSSKICTKSPQGDEVCFFACGKPPRPRLNTGDDLKLPLPAAENPQHGQPAVVNVAPEKKSTEGPVTILPVAAAYAVSNNPQQHEPTPSPDQFFPMPSIEPNAFPKIEVVEIVPADSGSLTGSPYPVAPMTTSEPTTELLPMPSDQMKKMDYSSSDLPLNTYTGSADAMTVPPTEPMSIPSVVCDRTLCPQPMPAPTCIYPTLETKHGECCPTLVCAGGYSTPSCKIAGCQDGKQCVEMCASCWLDPNDPDKKCPENPCTSTCI